VNPEAVTAALAMVVDWEVLLGAVGGVGLGMVVAIIPGLTGVMAVALALPFTFFLDATTSIAVLLGIYVTAIYGGSVTAIMIATPGTPNAAATLLDGYPLARQGRAREALQMALYASLTGGLISTLVALLIFPVVAAFALRFGPPQMFALILFSITIIAGVSGASLLKGFIAAVLGFLLATIGQDVIHGSSRFTFGSSELLAGLHILPVMIGLFTIPEIVLRCVESRDPRGDVLEGDLGPGLTLRQYLREWATFLRSSCIGSLLGALPGIGGSPAAFLSYFMAQRLDRHPERFGKGAITGVAAAESGNNAVCGPALVPMMSLGIPGDTTTAVIMGALIIHGLAPGPMLFATQPEFVYSVFFLLFLCLIVLWPFGLVAIRFAGVVARVRPQVLFPVVLVFAAFGAYAIRNSVADVVSMFLVGVLGFFMRIQGIPAAPFAIAFILGPLLEENFRRSMLMSLGSPSIFLESPLSIAFLALAALSAAATALAHRRVKNFTRLTSG
jgi:putative tricarboxylic transport membrane protein